MVELINDYLSKLNNTFVFAKESDAETAAEMQEAKTIALTFGHNVTFFEYDAVNTDHVSNVPDIISIPSKPRHFFINAAAKDSCLQLLGYQLTKSLKNDDQDLYECLRDIALSYSVGKVRGVTEVDLNESLMTSEKFDSEIIASIVGKEFGQENFWQYFAENGNQDTSTNFLQYAKTFFNRVINKVKSFNLNSNKYGSQARHNVWVPIQECVPKMVAIFQDYAANVKAGFDVSKLQHRDELSASM